MKSGGEIRCAGESYGCGHFFYMHGGAGKHAFGLVKASLANEFVNRVARVSLKDPCQALFIGA